MKKIGDIMKEMGFREDASNSVKEAFIKNLIKSAYGVDVETPSEKRTKEIKKLTGQSTEAVATGAAASETQPAQMSFDFTKVS